MEIMNTHFLHLFFLVCAGSLAPSESLNFFLAEKCRWTWVTLSRGFFESGSLVIGSGVRAPSPSFVLCMYLTCTVHDSTEPRGWGWEGSRCSEANSYCVKMSIRNSVNVIVSSILTIWVIYKNRFCLITRLWVIVYHFTPSLAPYFFWDPPSMITGLASGQCPPSKRYSSDIMCCWYVRIGPMMT